VRSVLRIQAGRRLRPAVIVVTLLAGMAAGVGAGAAPSPAASTTASLPAASPPTNVGQAQQQLAAGQRRVSQLAGSVTGAGQLASDLGASISVLQGRVTRLQGDLGARRRELLRVRDKLDAAQTKLGGLQAAKAAAELVLAHELVGNYEGGRPDIIGVVLESNGFADLLERLAFVQRISRQDARVVAHVRFARRAVATEAKKLGRLTVRAQNVAESVLTQRNQVARFRLSLVTQQLAAAKAKATAAGQLASAQVEVAQLTQLLAVVRAAQPAAAASPSSGFGAGATNRVAGMPFPLPAGSVAPPATWSLGEGVSIAAPAGTPELAVCNGTIVLHGIGGLGPSAPVLRCDQPLAGYFYVYYGYVGSKRLAAIGANVARGQPLARVGDGRIGTSAGPHVEIGFADSSGTPLGPATAHQMLTLLRAAYAT
jgi:murein DD-endopeptidase MepM/ murein hydrolase activator NlpD